jgi:hypothetical protein
MVFRPTPNERELEFGLKWAALGCFSALVVLSACSYIIPKDPSAPRYNTVAGERRVPALNPGGDPRQAGLTQVNAEQMKPTHAPALNPLPSTAMPVAPPEAPMVNNVTARASVPPAISAVPETARRGQPPQGWFSRQWDWVSGKNNNVAETPIPLGVPLPAGSMVMPAKNNVQLAMADREEYPKLETVPPAPQKNKSADSPQVRLGDAKRGMEAERNLNERARDVLKHEATSEPTLLEEYGTTPPALGEEGALEPITLAPPMEEQPATIKIVRGTEISEQPLRSMN